MEGSSTRSAPLCLSFHIEQEEAQAGIQRRQRHAALQGLIEGERLDGPVIDGAGAVLRGRLRLQRNADGQAEEVKQVASQDTPSRASPVACAGIPWRRDEQGTRGSLGCRNRVGQPVEARM